MRRRLFLACLLMMALGFALPNTTHGNEATPKAALLGQGQSFDNAVQRGAYLARVGDCVACHTKRDGTPFAGGFPMPTPFGTLYSSNITPDRDFGIGSWSANDFYHMLHTGHARDGTLLYPAMPFPAYTKVTRTDSDAIFAFLTSLMPIHEPNQSNALHFPFDNRELLLGWRALYFRAGEFEPRTDKTPEWNRGAYFVEGLGHCGTCHTAINALGGNSASKAYAGGLIPMQNWFAPSLTLNKEAGLGDWSVDEIVALLKDGVSPRGTVYGPMSEVVHNSLQYLTAADVKAMAVYLTTLASHDDAPQSADQRGAATVSASALAQGRTIYGSACETCHLASGQGQPLAYPPLASNHSIEMESAVNAIRMVLNGGYPPQTANDPRPYGMPPFAQVLSDSEIAAVVTYIRVSWGNHGQPVSTDEVNRLRAAGLLD